jgi:hypothetical protein
LLPDANEKEPISDHAKVQKMRLMMLRGTTNDPNFISEKQPSPIAHSDAPSLIANRPKVAPQNESLSFLRKQCRPMFVRRDPDSETTSASLLQSDCSGPCSVLIERGTTTTRVMEPDIVSEVGDSMVP